jgi:hypothetical protein
MIPLLPFRNIPAHSQSLRHGPSICTYTPLVTDSIGKKHASGDPYREISRAILLVGLWVILVTAVLAV